MRAYTGYNIFRPLMWSVSTLVLIIPNLVTAQLEQIAAAESVYVHEIIIMSADGTNPRVIAGGAYEVEDPVWSPDGRTIAFSSREHGSWDIWLVDPDGSNRRRLTRLDEYQETSPTWRSDGNGIAYCSMISSLVTSKICVVDLNGTSTEISTIPTPSIYPDISANSDAIIVTTPTIAEYRGYDFGLAIWRETGLHFYKRVKRDELLSQARWSPDGTRIALRGNGAGFGDIYVLDFRDESLLQLTEHSSEESHPAWWPDGKSIVFASDRTRDFDLYRLNIETSAVVNLTNSPAIDELFPCVSPDGLQIAYTAIRAGDTLPSNWTGHVLRKGALPPDLQTGKFVEDSSRRLSPWRWCIAWRHEHVISKALLGKTGELIGVSHQSGQTELLYMARDFSGYSLVHGGPIWTGTFAQIDAHGSVSRVMKPQRIDTPPPLSARYAKWPYLGTDGVLASIPEGHVLYPIEARRPSKRPRAALGWLIELVGGAFYCPDQSLVPQGPVIWVETDGQDLRLFRVERRKQTNVARISRDGRISSASDKSDAQPIYWPWFGTDGNPTFPASGYVVQPDHDPKARFILYSDGAIGLPPSPPEI